MVHDFVDCSAPVTLDNRQPLLLDEGVTLGKDFHMKCRRVNY